MDAIAEILFILFLLVCFARMRLLRSRRWAFTREAACLTRRQLPLAEGLGKMADAYLAGADAKTPTASPVYADLAGLPPLLVHVGDRETLLDDSTRFGERARLKGDAAHHAVSVPVGDAVHQQYQPAGRQTAQAAVALDEHDALAFARRRHGSHEPGRSSPDHGDVYLRGNGYIAGRFFDGFHEFLLVADLLLFYTVQPCS